MITTNKNQMLNKIDEFNIWDYLDIVNYLVANYKQFLLLLLAIMIIFIVDHINHYNNALLGSINMINNSNTKNYKIVEKFSIKGKKTKK